MSNEKQIIVNFVNGAFSISWVTVGAVVSIGPRDTQYGRVEFDEDVGHVVGFGRNPQGELLLIVQWSRDHSHNPVNYPIHPSNLTLHV